jgi:hypothetical protein
MPTRKAVSLLFEVGELEGAVDAARLLVFDLEGQSMPGSPEAFRAIMAVGSVLSLILCRLKMLRGVISGDIEPGLLLARHNLVPAGSEGLGIKDVKLPVTPARARGR